MREKTPCQTCNMQILTYTKTFLTNRLISASSPDKDARVDARRLVQSAGNDDEQRVCVHKAGTDTLPQPGIGGDPVHRFARAQVERCGWLEGARRLYIGRDQFGVSLV